MIILLKMLKSYLKTWVKQRTISKTTLKYKHNRFMKETDLEEVNKYINNLDMKKVNDIYGISLTLIKIGNSKLKSHIAFIFNQCLIHGILPDKLKTTIVYPIHKGNSKHQCSNYRPISILPVLSKIFEKLMYCRLIEFLDKHKILYKKPFTFQKGKSTRHAILDLYSGIIKAIEVWKKTSCNMWSTTGECPRALTISPIYKRHLSLITNCEVSSLC